MGFFKKLFKGVKKVFKKIGSGIKKAVGKVGKFMGKLGIVGQIGLGLLLPGIGSMMGSMFGNLAGSLMSSTLGGIGGAVVRGAGQVINAAVNIGTKAGSMFSSITEGVTKVIGNVVGTAVNQIPGAGNLLKSMTGGKLDITSKSFSSLWKTTQDAVMDVAAKGGDLFKMDTLTGANKFLTDSALSTAEAALAGTDTGSTFSDAMLDDIPQTMQPGFSAQERVIEQGLDFTGAAPTQITTQADVIEAGLDYTGPKVGEVTGVVEPKPSLLAKAGTSMVQRTKEAIAGAPAQFVKTGVSSLANLPRDALIADIQGPPQVTYDVRQASIPDIGFAGIGQEMAQPSFDPVSYFDQNQATFAQSPFGFGARMYGEATYARNMQGYGFQIPMYGMS